MNNSDQIEAKQYANAIPAAWCILLGIEPTEKKYSPAHIERMEKRLAQLNEMNLRWCDVELNLERKQLENVLNQI